MPLQALKFYLLSEFGNKEYILIILFFKSNKNTKKTKDQDVDMNPSLSRNDPLLQVTDFGRARHIYYESNSITITICFKHLIQDLTTFQTLKTPCLNSRVSSTRKNTVIS